jgi:serine O-acetyltransferase
VIPEGFADPSQLGNKDLLRLLRRHRQLRAMLWFRLGEWGFGSARVRGLTWLADQRLQGQYGLDLAASVEIGGGFYLAHPAGCAINAHRIGRNVTLVASITVGIREVPPGPTIGDEVFIGAGARVIGPISVGDRARVGANAVVLDDIPSDATVVGIPARPVVRRATSGNT